MKNIININVFFSCTGSYSQNFGTPHMQCTGVVRHVDDSFCENCRHSNEIIKYFKECYLFLKEANGLNDERLR